MPDWVSNTLSAEDPLLIDDIIDIMGEEEEAGGLRLRFSNFFPPPVSVRLGSEELLRWKMENWGTAHIYAMDVYQSLSDLMFETAWFPVVPFVLEISRVIGPETEWEYEYNDGVNLHVKLTIKNGEIIEREDLLEVELTDDDLTNLAYNQIDIEEIRTALQRVDFDKDSDMLLEGGLWDLATSTLEHSEDILPGSDIFFDMAHRLYEMLWERAENALAIFNVKSREDFDNLSDEELEALSDKEIEEIANIIGNEE